MAGRRHAVLTLAVLAACAAGCTRTISDRDLKLVDVREGLELVEGRQRLLGLGGRATGAWVDPRTPRAYREGHISGAVNIPFQNVTAEHKTLRGYDVVVVYGDDYNDDVANGMSKRLMDLGLGDVRTLRGGLRAWKAAGRELVTGDEAARD